MAVVTEHVVSLVAKQVEDRSLVLWYDPEGVYTSVAENLDLPHATVARYDGSFLKLRRDIDGLLNNLEPPRLVVYVREDQAKTHNALAELEAAGVVMQPGQQPPTRNTRLAVVARNALRPILGDDTALEVERQVEAGKLSLADVNALAEKGQGISKGVVALVYGSGNPQDVALAFLDSDRLDAEVRKKSAEAELFSLLAASFGVDLPKGTNLPDARERLARHVLMTDLVTGLGTAVPHPLRSVTVAKSPMQADACAGLARAWRLRRDGRRAERPSPRIPGAERPGGEAHHFGGRPRAFVW